MTRRVTNPLSSYDLIAKSLPGVVLLLVTVSFLPRKYVPLTPVASSLAEYALTILAALLIGLFVGEGVHTFAELIEKSVRPIARIADEALSTVSIKLEETVVSRLPDPDSRLGAVVYLMWERLGWPIRGLVAWFVTRYWELHDVLKGHRLLFAHSLVWNFAQEPGEIGDRWDNRQKGHPYECFRECIAEEYGEDLLKNESGVAELDGLGPVEQYRSLYTLVSSEVSSFDAGLSSRFQAIYSFCRSMYVVFGLTAVAYWWILSPTLQDGWDPTYRPVLVSTLGREWYPVFVVVPVGLSLVFVVATGKYKRAYVDYLVSDFCALKRTDLAAQRQYSPGSGAE